MIQAPNLPVYQLPQPSYNAVKIDIHNPSVGGQTCPVAQPTMPQQTPYYYNYPQAPVYSYPQTNAQPYYMPAGYNMPVDMNTVNTQTAVNCQVPQPQAVAPAAPQQVNINQPMPVQNPVVQTNTVTVDQPKVEVEAPVQAAQPQVDLNSFLAKLTNPDFEVQASTMEDIADMVKNDPQRATELIDAKVMDALINIMNVDSSKLAGPTQEQAAIRDKMANGKEVTDKEKEMAALTPKEQAERNKSYAMFTTAILDKLYGDEVMKLTGNRVPLTELPGAINIVDQLKDNPIPLVRVSAIDAMSYLQTPEYKKDLTTLFTIAKNDVDNDVQSAANTALDKLSQV